MRLLVISTLVFPDSLSGSARHLTEVSAHLAERGHEVEILTRRERRSQPAHEIYRGMSIRRFGDPRVHRLASKSLAEIGDVWGAIGACSPYDLVMGHHCTPTWGALLRGLSTPLVYQFHASAYLEAIYRGPEYYQRLAGPLARVKPAAFGAFTRALKAVESRVLDAADRVLVLSRFSESILRTTYPHALGRVHIIPGGVDSTRFVPATQRPVVRARLGIEENERLIVTVRRLVPRMGVSELLRAVAAIRPRLGSFRLAVVGDGPLRSELRRECRSLGLDDVVTFVGLAPEEELPSWYQAADLFVLPTQAYEGFGMVTPEALACGTPVVGTPAGATPELLEDLDPRLLSDGRDPEAIGSAILRFFGEIDGPGVRDAAREYCERRFAWPAVIDRYEEVLDDVLRLHRRRRVALVGPRPDSEGGVGVMVRLIRDSSLARRNRLVTVATYRDGSRPQKLVQAAGGLARLGWLCGARRVDLVHLHASWDASFSRKAVALAVCRLTGRPAVLHIHGGGLHREIERAGVTGRARRRAIRWALTDANAVVALTPGWAEGLNDMAPGREIIVIPNAPDLAVAAPRTQSPERRTILFLGHLYREKGVFELVEAFARLAPGRPDLRLVLAGAGRERDNLAARAAELGLGPGRLELPGWIGGAAKTELLAEAAVFALPSWEEGLPLALLEAMAAGVPIVATEVGGMPEAVRAERDGLLIARRNVDALEAALARILDDDELSSRLGASARERARAEFSTDALARRVEAVYRGVMSES